MSNETRPISHIRTAVIQRGRRINDGAGSAGRTVCGAAVTAYDMTAADAKRLTAETAKQFNVCVDCLAKVPR